MAKIESIYLGSTREIKIGIAMSNGSFHLADATTNFKAKFYVKERSETKIIEFDKSELFISEDEPDYFTAHVPTVGEDESGAWQLPLGRLCCTVEGTYLDTEHSTMEKQIILPFVQTCEIPADIKAKFI